MTSRTPIITYDRTAQVYELWASEAQVDYLGSFDTRAEAVAYFKRWLKNEV